MQSVQHSSHDTAVNNSGSVVWRNEAAGALFGRICDCTISIRPLPSSPPLSSSTSLSSSLSPSLSLTSSILCTAPGAFSSMLSLFFPLMSPPSVFHTFGTPRFDPNPYVSSEDAYADATIRLTCHRRGCYERHDTSVVSIVVP